MQLDVEQLARVRARVGDGGHEIGAIGLDRQIANLHRAAIESQIAGQLFACSRRRPPGQLLDVDLHAGLLVREPQFRVQARDVFEEASRDPSR